jgi:adenine C2-methylase RlmN of 23S rRNA A2503 and tRNA A37
MERTETFREILESRGIHAFIRHPRGRDILAACGQLAAKLPLAHVVALPHSSV